MIRQNTVVGLALAAALAMTGTAHAETDAAKEVSTAAQHAGFANKASDMKAVQMHLQHVVNCLVGPNGQGFDTKQANPCKDQGSGAIPDTTDAAQKKRLSDALAKVNSGLKQTDVAAAQKDAADAQALLSSQM